MIAELPDEEEEYKKQERAQQKKKEEEVMEKLVSPCLREVNEALIEGRFRREVWGRGQDQLSRIALFR